MILLDRPARVLKDFVKARLPDGEYSIRGRRILLSRRDAAYARTRKSAAKPFTMPAYTKAAAELYNELKHASHAGLHPKLRGIAQTVSSWIPFVPGQTVARLFNFLSMHYGLNNPMIVVYRYLLRDVSGQVFDRSYTRVMLPNTACAIGDPPDADALALDGFEGRLIVYVYDPRFTPFGNEFRFVGTYKSGGTYKCGCHSWGSSADVTFGARNSFSYRRFVPAEGSYRYYAEIGRSVDCDAEDAGHGTIALKPGNGASIYGSGGYLIGMSPEREVCRIWHDNGPHGHNYQFPTAAQPQPMSVETDFYIPARGFDAVLLIQNPLLDQVCMDNRLHVSAYGSGSSVPILERDFKLDFPEHRGSEGQYAIDLKNFFVDLHARNLADDILEITGSFVPIFGSIRKEALGSVQFQVFLRGLNGEMCDQYHTQMSSNNITIASSRGSYRTNKFGPFVCDRRHSSFIIIDNKFPFGRTPTPHKVRLALAENESDEYVVRFVSIDPQSRYGAFNVAKLFGLEDGKSHEGMIHLYCSTANFWSYYLTVGRDERNRVSLLCDHTTGG